MNSGERAGSRMVRARSIRIALAHAAVVLVIYLAFILKHVIFDGG